MRTWDELSADEQEVVKRLPGSADYPAVEREHKHRWCTRCWYEAFDDEEHVASGVGAQGLSLPA